MSAAKLMTRHWRPGICRFKMHAQLLQTQRRPLLAMDLARPEPAEHELLIRVRACGVCRTDLHIIDGELSDPKLPLVPGHEIVGEIVARGAGVSEFALGERVGVTWLGHTCGKCMYCLKGQENLCASARFTGYHIDGGYAEFAVADARYCFRIPDAYSDAEAAPLLCAGLIGFRALHFAGNAQRIGLYGFGAAAHILAQLCMTEDREVYVFVRPGDEEARAFALSLGARWCGDSETPPPQELDAALIFAPSGPLVPRALRTIRKGGTVVCAGIHMSDIPSFPYAILWGERILRSVANLTRADGEAFFSAIARHPIQTHVQRYGLRDANRALDDLRGSRVQGAAVLLP